MPIESEHVRMHACVFNDVFHRRCHQSSGVHACACARQMIDGFSELKIGGVRRSEDNRRNLHSKNKNLYLNYTVNPAYARSTVLGLKSALEGLGRVMGGAA